MPKKAVIYCRFSPRKNASECLSCETQETYCRQYATMQGMEVIGVFKDENVSGKSTSRAGLDPALDLVCREKAVLIVYSMSRLARNTSFMLDLAVRLEKAGAEFASLHEHIDTSTPAGRFFFTVMAALAQMQREQTAELTSEAMLAHQAAGRRMSKRVRYGYEEDPDSELSSKKGKDGKRHRVGIRESKQELENIRLIMELWDSGKGTYQIKQELEKRGIDFRGKKNWHRSTLTLIIDRELRERLRRKRLDEKAKGA